MKTGYSMMKAMSIAVLAIATCAMAFDDVQVTYRGMLRENGVAPAPQTVAMEFRLYAKKKDATPSWTAEIPAVSIDRNGLFQVALRGEGLAGVIDGGRANWIGVSIGGGKEQYPRQALTANPHADKAMVAERLADSPSVKTAAVASVAAKTLSASSIDVGGSMSIPATTAVLPVDVKLTRAWWTLPVKGNVRFFNGTNPRVIGTTAVSDGECSFGRADCNCVALFSSVNSDIMPGMSLFFKKNETIRIPSGAGLDNGTSVFCMIYPIGVE